MSGRCGGGSTALDGQQFADREQCREWIAPLLEDLGGALAAVHDREDAHDLGLVGLGGGGGDQGALAAGDDVVEDGDALVSREMPSTSPRVP